MLDADKPVTADVTSAARGGTAIRNFEVIMSGGSTLNPENLPYGPRPRKVAKGHDTASLGPSDSSDTGSDVAASPETATGDTAADVYTDEGSDELITPAGSPAVDDNSDRYGTGERLTADNQPSDEADVDHDADRIVDGEEAGLGGGLDQAEEARLGITDEEIERAARDEQGRRHKR